MNLEPLGEHDRAPGVTRYAIWHWTDKTNDLRIPCAGVAALASAKGGDGTCADRPVASFPRRWKDSTRNALSRILCRQGLIEEGGRLTELGSVVAFFFNRRCGVKAGWESAHGTKAPW